MTRAFVITTLLFATTSTVSAQVGTFTVPGGHHPHVVPVVPFPAFNVPSHSSTAYEGARRGDAAVIEAYGFAIEAESRSNINNQVARQLQIANKKTEIETRQKLRELSQKKQAEQFAENRVKRQNYRQQNVPLTPTPRRVVEFDASSGSVLWPAVLQDATYSRSRGDLEELLHMWAAGEWSVDLAQEIDQAAETLKQELKTNMKSMRPSDYLAAKQLLDNLAAIGRTAPDA